MSEIRLSASLYQRFQTCPKSAVFSVDHEAKAFSKPSLRAALGNVSHKLIEDSVRIPQDWKSDQIHDWFEVNWETFVEKQYAELVENGLLTLSLNLDPGLDMLLPEPRPKPS